jgi:hypothetical protein
VSPDLPLSHPTSCPHHIHKENIFQLVVTENKISKNKSKQEKLVLCGLGSITYSLLTIVNDYVKRMVGPERLTVKSRNVSEKVPETGLQLKLTQEGKKSSPTYRWKDMHFLKHTYFNSRKTSTTTI